VTDDGALVALPIMVHNCAMYYRTNLFEKAGLSGAPKSWDEYRDFAKKTTDSANGIFGTMVCSKQSIEAATRLHSFYQQAGGDLLDASGARGAVVHVQKFCEPELFDVPMLRRFFDARGVPVLYLEGELEADLSGQAVTRLEAFVELLSAKGTGRAA